MNIKELEKALASYGIEDARAEAFLIIERLFGVSRGSLLINQDKDFSSRELDELLEKRKNRIPLQYIFGEWEFMGKRFYVSRDCLIPQPDTEILVEKALELLKTDGGVWDFSNKNGNKGENAQDNSSVLGKGENDRIIKVADLCTGSGCIGLSLLMYGPLLDMTLMDLSQPALEIAKKNAALHGLTDKCRFILGDIRKDMPKDRFDLIVSNPPYIPTRDIENLPSEVKKEPLLALDGGADGLDLIRFLIGDGLSYLKENGIMLIEFGFDQGDIMNTLLREKCDTGSIKSYEILKDYGGNPRVAVIYA
ncbi:MAG: peptide chain release factor N(5)-glutamine methyltransferase [Clostridia bacterium]|nr:peptide chain release factor N(5)-glutamine methyltransferase [Clostridia bacterium]